jgi:putative lipoic acid-binding regulatory protein
MSEPETSENALWNFPCEYQCKVVCLSSPEAEQTILACVSAHLETPLTDSALHRRDSSHGNYTAITITFMAHSKQQLDAIYQDLTACPVVKFAL